jgi:hypothetical protein
MTTSQWTAGPAHLLWVDAGNGAAGDMLLAALLDAGASMEAVRDGLGGLDVEPLEVSLTRVRRHGLRATRAQVGTPSSDVVRNLADVRAILAGLGAGPVHDFAAAVFTRLAGAEARVHGVPVEEIHFHEVGALDAIADVAGCALALHSLGLLTAPIRVVSPIAVGSGTVRSAHGELPVPVPAVVELLRAAGAPVRAHPAEMELCTPTGAALLCELATGWGPVPDCTPVAVGVGAGSADPAGHPNALRVVVGRLATGGSDGGWSEAGLIRLDATVDDLDPRLWPEVLAALRANGALDAWCTPALMHKGRPGQVLSVLSSGELVDAICQVIFRETTTLGVRMSPVRRRSLRRDAVTVEVAGGTVAVKRGFMGGEVVTVQPEYDDVLAVARDTGRPPAEVMAEAKHRAKSCFSPDGQEQ